jgi:hypothetical protein
VLVKRGLLVLIFLLAASGTAVFTITFSRFFQVEAKFAMAVGVGFGILLAWAAAPVLKGATRRIDRAFFRSAYNAQQILEDLASKSRTATSRGELAGLLEQHLQQALHPTFQVLYLEGKDGRLELERTGDSSYATLFFADYDDSTRRLRYVNCGHLPPLLLHGC